MQPWGQLDKILLPARPGGGGNGQAYGMVGRGSMPLSAHDLQSYARPQTSLPLNLMPPLNGVMGANSATAFAQQAQHAQHAQHQQLQQPGGAHMSLPCTSGDMQHDNRSLSSTLVVCLPSPHMHWETRAIRRAHQAPPLAVAPGCPRQARGGEWSRRIGSLGVDVGEGVLPGGFPCSGILRAHCNRAAFVVV